MILQYVTTYKSCTILALNQKNSFAAVHLKHPVTPFITWDKMSENIQVFHVFKVPISSEIRM